MCIRDRFKGINQETALKFFKKHGFCNGEKIKQYKGSLLIIHAKNDQIIPFEQGEILYNNCPSRNKSLLSIPNANHNNILSINPEKYFEEIEKLFALTSHYMAMGGLEGIPKDDKDLR